MSARTEVAAASREAEQAEAKAMGFALAHLAGRLDRVMTITARHIVQTEDTALRAALDTADADIAAYVALAQRQVTK